MTMTYTGLTNLADSLDKELTDMYSHNTRLTDTNHVVVKENLRLTVLVDILKTENERLKIKLIKHNRALQ